MQQVKLSGSVTVAPPTVSDSTFPGGVYTGVLTTLPSPKQAPVYDSHTRNLNAPSDYVTLYGIGPADTVTKGNFLFIRTTSLIWFEVTFQNTPSNTVSEFPVMGTMLIEVPDLNAITLLRAKGTGYIEYCVTGNQLTRVEERGIKNGRVPS